MITSSVAPKPKSIALHTIQLFAWMLLLAAVIWGATPPPDNLLVPVQDKWPEIVRLELLENDLYKAYAVDERLVGYLSIASGTGWGGPLRVAALVTPAAEIADILLIRHNETPSFVERLEKTKFFRQFPGRDITAAFEAGRDIDSVTNCTVSSRAITHITGLAAHRAARTVFSLNVIDPTEPIHYNGLHIMLAGLFAAAPLSAAYGFYKARYLIMASALVVLGYGLNGCLSLGNISALLTGSIPAVSTNVTFYIVVTAAFFYILLRKNFYCYWICPYGSVQEFISKITGVKIQVGSPWNTVLRFVPVTICWVALMYALIHRKPGLAAFEPFPTFFSLNGTFIDWAVFAFSIAGMLVIPRFWCTYLCPVRVVLTTAINLYSRCYHRLSTFLKNIT